MPGHRQSRSLHRAGGGGRRIATSALTVAVLLLARPETGGILAQVGAGFAVLSRTERAGGRGYQ
jgi:hypothetical protein